MYVFINSINKHLLSVYYRLGAVRGSKPDEDLCFHGVHIQGEGNRQYKIKTIRNRI